MILLEKDTILTKKNVFQHSMKCDPGFYDLKIWSKKMSGPGVFFVKIYINGVIKKKEKIIAKGSPSEEIVGFEVKRKSGVSILIDGVLTGNISIKRINVDADNFGKKQKPEKKVAIVIPYSILGGAEIYVKRLSEIISQDNRVDFIYIAKNPLINIINNYNVRHINCFGFRNFSNYILSNNYDVIFYYNSKKVFDNLKNIGISMSSKLVEIVHSELTWSDSISLAEDRSHVDSVVVISDHLKVKHKNKLILGPPINTERFKPFGIGKIIGTVARFSNEKNLYYILDLANHMPNHKFLIIGDGALKQTFIYKMKERGVKNIEILGFQKDIENYYPKFGAFILPSSMEGLPITILEALSSNIPVFATRVGGISNLIDLKYAKELTLNCKKDSENIKKYLGKPTSTRNYIEENYSYNSFDETIDKLLQEIQISCREKYITEQIKDFYYV